MSEYLDRVRRFEEELLNGYPDPGGLVRLSLSPQFLASLGKQEHRVLISCAASITGLAWHVQISGNLARAEVTHLRRTLEYNKNKTIGSISFNARETDKAKIATAYERNPELVELDSRLAEAEQRAIYYERLPDILLELVNVMKKEIDRKKQENHIRSGV